MANYELSNIAWKGNTYTVKDNSALHQSAIGSWTPDFANLKVLATYEYDISSKSYFKICERPNVTAIKDIADEVLAFRITVTGTNIFSIADVLVRLQPTVNVRPLVTVNYQTQSTSAATTGIRYLRTVNPKAANTSYTYAIAIAAYNTTRRHIKVEVFKAPSDWTFSSAATVYSDNDAYQTASNLTLYSSIGIFYNYTFYATVNYANYAGYKSSWDGLFNGQGSFISAGVAIAANQFAFIGKDNKIYPTTSTSVEIDPAWPIVYCTTAYAAGAAMGWSAIRSWGYFTPAESILKDGTLIADDTVYMRCTYTDGKLYSANTMTQTLTAGNTYIKLGKMYNATAVSVNTYNSEYFTLDTDGHIKALNGYLFNSAKADTASAVSKAGSTATGSYGILFDNNLITNALSTTTSPRVNANLTFNPSTGNLSSTLFTGSGAGLTDIPVDELNDAVPLDKGGTGLADLSGNSWYDSVKLHPHFEILYGDGFFVIWNGPLDNIASVSDFLASDYFKYAQKETHPIISNGAYLGSAMLFTGAFDSTPDPTRLYFVFPDAVYFGGSFVNGLSCNLTYDPDDGGIIGLLSSMLPSVPKWAMILSDVQTELLGKEVTDNKVTSVDSGSSDVQYPSAKLLYDTKNTLSGMIQDVDENAEKTINKVMSISSSSTDTQYPSAKSVYDAIPSKVDYSNTPFVGTCTTAAGTMAKTVTVDSSFQLVDGVRVRVYMDKANTNTTPTLNVNGTGAKSIGIQHPYGDVSNIALSTWYSGAFNRKGWYDFVYAASYNSGNGRWIIEDSPAPIRLANFVASGANRVTTINSINGTLVNGGVRYTVVASSATGNPFTGTAAVLWLSYDNSAAYTRQIAMSANTPPCMAFRSQDSGGGTTWQPWEYVLTAANQSDAHMATLAYTASGLAFSNNALTIPIDGTEYKILQINVSNNDLTYGLGWPRTFIFNAAGTTGYIENTSYYCSASSAASGITVTFDSSWATSASTNVDITVLYRRIS